MYIQEIYIQQDDVLLDHSTQRSDFSIALCDVLADRSGLRKPLLLGIIRGCSMD